MFSVKPVAKKVSEAPQAENPLQKKQDLPSPLKVTEQTWTRSFSGSAQGVNFQLRIQREASGHLHARYQVVPGRKSSGWHLEGQVREDDSFVLKGTENDAIFEGQFGLSGHLLTASFRNKAFVVDSMRLIRTSMGLQTRSNSSQEAKTRLSEAPEAQASPQPEVSAETGEVVSAPAQGGASRWEAVKTGFSGFDGNPELQQAIVWGAAELNVNPNALAAVIGYESAGTFSPGVENEAAKRQGKKGAVGLIQFTPSVGIPALNHFLASPAGRARARELGISATSVSREGLLEMSPTEQMKFVVLYFNIPVNRLNPHDEYDAIYQEILAPGRESEIWYRASDKSGNYAANRQFDSDGDGIITRLEAAGEIEDQGFVINYFKQGSVADGTKAGMPVQETGQNLQNPQKTGKVTPETSEPQRAEPQKTDFDTRVSQALEAFTDRFTYPISVSWKEGQNQKSKQLHIRTPYFIYSGEMKDSAMANRARMSQADRRAFEKAPTPTKFGKGSPEEMASFTQTLIDLNPFGVPAKDITAGMVTGWLKKYGIGVDCSGFVTQMLDYATTEVVGKDPKLGNTGVREFRNSTSLHGNAGEFRKVASPAEVRPGDTMWLQGHIRIVTRVGPGPGGKGIQMMIAESTPNEQLPASLAQGGVYRIGVDKAIWWFPNADRFTKTGVQKKVSGYEWNSSAADEWDTPNTLRLESMYFSRYQPLAAGKK